MTGEGGRVGGGGGGQVGRRAGRRAGGSTAREDILGAARDLFGAHGFDRTTMRQVAEAAGVDVALISHYFGSKRGLFVAAVDFPSDPEEVLAPLRSCPEGELGATALRAVLEVWDSAAGPGVVARFRQALAGEEGALVRDLLTGVILPAVGERLVGDDLDVRLGLFASQVAGLLMTRHLVGLPAVAGASHDALVAAVGPTLQRYLTGDLG